MTWVPPPRPVWVDEVNALGRHAGGAERIVALDEESLLAAACAATGLDDFGDFGDAEGRGWREGWSVLLGALGAEAQLHLVGRLLARSELLRALTARLEVTATRALQPEIARQIIEAPVFVTGTGRSGTSILHELLAQDPRHRVLRTWEALYPCPAPERAKYHLDARIERADRDVRLWDHVAPEYRTMHENGGDVPQECIALTAQHFASELWGGSYPVPSYSAWLAGTDLAPAYAWHRSVLQLLQWRCAGDRWVLKAPSHLAALPALFAEYPDAQVVVVHRDPLRVLPSLASLVGTLRWMRTDEVDFPAIVRATAKGTARLLAWVTELRDRGDVPAAQVHDVRYADLVADPWDTMRGIYSVLGVDLPGDVLSRMQGYLATRPQGRHGAHSYAFDDLGLDRDAERGRYADYMARYGVTEEV